MQTSTQVLQQLESIFGAAECTAAKHLFAYLNLHPEASHITLQLTRRIIESAGFQAPDSSLVKTLQFLSAESVGLLSTSFELVIDDQTPYNLTIEEVKLVMAEKVNPISGESDPTIESKVSIFFSPTDAMRVMLQNEHSWTGHSN